MGEKRGRAEANDDERQAPTDGNTRRTAGMTHDGTENEAKRYCEKCAVSISSKHKRERTARRQTATQSDAQPQKGVAGHIGRGIYSIVFLKDYP